MKEGRRGILTKELDHTYSGVYDMWSLYLKWYTFFFTSNLIVMSWIFTNPEEIKSVEGNFITVLSIFWIIFNVTGIITSVLVAQQSRKANDRIDKILAKLDFRRDMVMRKSPIPDSITRFGGLANAFSLFLVLIAWAYILVKLGLKS